MAVAKSHLFLGIYCSQIVYDYSAYSLSAANNLKQGSHKVR